MLFITQGNISATIIIAAVDNFNHLKNNSMENKKYKIYFSDSKERKYGQFLPFILILLWFLAGFLVQNLIEQLEHKIVGILRLQHLQFT